MGKPTNHQKKSLQNEKKKYGKLPGTGSPSRLGSLSRYNALPTELLGTCHEWRANYNFICNKWTTYCKYQMRKDSEEKRYESKMTFL